MRGVSEDALLNPIVWWPCITKYIWHKILWREILACYSFFLYDRDVYCKIQGSVPRVVFCCCYEIKYLNVAQSELYWQVSGRGHKPRTWFTLYWSFHFSYSPLWELSLTWRPCLISFLHMHSSCIDRCASWYNIFGSRNVRLRANGGIDGSIFFPQILFLFHGSDVYSVLNPAITALRDFLLTRCHCWHHRSRDVRLSLTS